MGCQGRTGVLLVRPCHQRAFHSSQERPRADNHGQRHGGLNLHISLPSQVASLPDLALQAGGRSRPASALPCPAGRSALVAKDQSADGVSDRTGCTSRSALGPCRNGPVGASAVANGHRWFGETAGRLASRPCSWDDAVERFRLWSRRSGLPVASITHRIPQFRSSLAPDRPRNFTAAAFRYG